MHSRRAFIGGLMASSQLSARTADPHWLTLEEAAAGLRKRSLSPVELTQACLQRIEKLNPVLNCFITVTAEQALSDARQAETALRTGRPRGALHGIPVALKDLIDTAGIKTTAASKHYEGRVPKEDAPVVRRLKEAGAIVLGKLNMDEFAYNYTAETSCFGPSRNPWDTARSPGGSSGGSAVAVAAGLCFAALGSDTGGSIRLPASLCGIVGYKPSYGRVPTDGAVPLAWSLDHIGPMCRTVGDAARVFEVIAAAPAPVGANLPKPVRIGLPRALFQDGVHPGVLESVDQALKILEQKGARIQDVKLPDLSMAPEVPDLPLPYIRVITAEAWAFHEEMLKRSPDLYHPGTRQSIQNGAGVTTAQYIHAVRDMQQRRASSAAMFQNVDVLITPSAPAPAFRLGDKAGLIFLRNFAPWNLYGVPSASVPCGMVEGLPVGLQIVGPAGRDDLVLGLASAWQAATDWHTRRPPL